MAATPVAPLFLDFTFYFSYIASNFRVLMDARRSGRMKEDGKNAADAAMFEVRGFRLRAQIQRDT